MSPFKISSVSKKLSKIDLKSERDNYSLKPFVEKWIRGHPPTLSYSRKPDTKSFGSWKQEIHDLISRKVKILEPLPLNEQIVKFHGESEANGIKFIKLSLMALPNMRVPAILCIPNTTKPKNPAVICIHGHGQSKENVVGIKKSKSKEYSGYELAKLGFITLSLDWIGMGEREPRKNKISFFPSYEGQRSNWIRFLGLDMLGLRITEIKAFLNYLETRDEVEPKKFGIIGHSGGGTLSLFTSVLDKRIKVCCTSGYFGSWEHSILAMYHCGCNYSGNLGKYIEMYDVYASLAPLPMAATIGRKDPIYPIKGTEKAIPIIKKAYEEAGQPENFMIDVQPKGHQFYKEQLYPFILRHL